MAFRQTIKISTSLFIENLKEQGALVFLSATLLVLSDFIAIHWMGLAEKFPRPLWGHWFQAVFFCYLLNLCFSKRAFFIWIRVLFIFSFLQWLCLSYYGSYLSPMMIYLFFRDFAEVLESSKGAGSQIIKPLIMGTSGMFLIWILAKLPLSLRSPSSIFPSLRSQQFLRYFIFFVVLYPVPRTFFTGHTFGKQAKVQELSLVNFYGALSYFTGRILPAKANAILQTSSGSRITDGTEKREALKLVDAHPRRHVVFILGESLGFRHLQLYGYSIETTPYLTSWYQQNKLMLRRGVSGGVSTDVSIPMLIHATSGMNAASHVASQDRCLFKLAKENGFQTAFISVQNQENLQHITNFFCNTYLDYFKVGDNARAVNGEPTALDGELLSEIQALSWKNPQFVILHQRGSHSPYEMRYPPEMTLRPIQPSDSWESKLVKHYDNSVYYTDQNLISIVDWIRAHSELPTEVIFTSDHGEALGEDQQWGHVILHPVAAEVPVIYFPEEEAFKTAFSQQKEWVSHEFVSSFLIHLLGYSLELGSENRMNQNYFVLGADLDGLGGFMKVTPQGTELIRVSE